MKVAIIRDNKIRYNQDAPFSPSEFYPEYPFKDIGRENTIYDSVRNILYALGMDRKNYNDESWNPLGKIISPKDNVLVKPNLVRHYNQASSEEILLTHGSIIRAILDYVYIALKGEGNVIIGDAPLQSADFGETIKNTGIDKIIGYYDKNSNIKIGLIDFRTERVCRERLDILKRERLKGDPSGYTAIDLKDDSELFDIIDGYMRFRVTNYNKANMIKHHNKDKNEYLIPNSVLNSDVIINLPKLKTHRKAGMTCALKNLIGVNGSKDWLPHHRFGSLEEGGDEYLHKSIRKRMLTRSIEKMDTAKSRFDLILWAIFNRLINGIESAYPHRDQYFEGSWYGNDTIPRTTIDINKIIFYANKNGVLKDKTQRKMFIIADAIVSGEKEGPLKSSPKYCGLLVAGYNPVAIDLVCSRIMGFDYSKIPTLSYALNAKKFELFEANIEDIEILSNNCKNYEDIYNMLGFNFIPSNGWRGHIEYENMG